MTAAGRADSSDVPDKAGQPGVRRRQGQTMHDSKDGRMTAKMDGQQMTAKMVGTTEGRWTHDSDDEQVTRWVPAPVPPMVPMVLLVVVQGTDGVLMVPAFRMFACNNTPICLAILPVITSKHRYG